MTFGRLAAEDRRDREHRMAPRRRVSLSQSKFWQSRDWGDQNDAPACVGFAWAHWLECLPIRQWVDPVGVYDLAQHVDEWPGENYAGTSVRAGAKVLQSIGAIEAYQWAWDAKVIARHVLTIGPVVVGTEWYGAMHEPGARGLVALEGEYLGGHAWLVDGWDGRRQEFRAKNSWGRAWGDRGRFRIALDDMQTLLDADGEACVGVERRIRTFASSY